MVNTYQPNERHVKVKSATLKLGSGSAEISAACSGMESRQTCEGPINAWANIGSSGLTFDLIPEKWISSNDGIVVPDLSYHGASIVVDFAENLSESEKTRREDMTNSRLFAIAPGNWYSNYANLSTPHYGSLEDEKETYDMWEWSYTSDQLPSDPHKPVYWISWKNIDVHYGGEADDLWQNIMMYLRVGSQGYLDRVLAWARYFKWEYTFRTDGFSYAWNSDWESPKVERPKIEIPLTDTDKSYMHTYDGVPSGRIDTRSRGGCHLYGWGLIDYYYLTGDVDAKDAANDIGEISKRIFGWRVPGEKRMAYYGTRQGGRHLIFATRLYEVTQDPIWEDYMFHLGELWIQSPDWDERGFYPFGDWETDYKLCPDDNRYCGAYNAGARSTSTFSFGILNHGLGNFYALTLDDRFRERLIALAYWVKEYGLHPEYLHSGSTIALDWPSMGEVYHSKSAGPDEVDPSYTVSLIDSLVRGYQFTKDLSLLERSKLHWDRGSKGQYGKPYTYRTAEDNEVGHFANKYFDSSSGYLYYGNNKGELNYCHLLFYEYAHPEEPDTTPPAQPTGLRVE